MGPAPATGLIYGPYLFFIIFFFNSYNVPITNRQWRKGFQKQGQNKIRCRVGFLSKDMKIVINIGNGNVKRGLKILWETKILEEIKLNKDVQAL